MLESCYHSRVGDRLKGGSLRAGDQLTTNRAVQAGGRRWGIRSEDRDEGRVAGLRYSMVSAVEG